MSRRIILKLAAAATLAAATFASCSADAKTFRHGDGLRGGSFGGRFASFTGHGGRLIPILNPGRPGRPGHPIPPPIGFHDHDHHHHHWVFRDGRWIFLDEVIDEPAVVTAPGPCTCLTKTYTPTGLVVFADICTKESASASVDGTADATQVPTTPVAATAVPMAAVPTAPNYAGRTYEDYLAANPQAANPPAASDAQKN